MYFSMYLWIDCETICLSLKVWQSIPFLMVVQWMSNKAQLHLKTINFQEWSSPCTQSRITSYSRLSNQRASSLPKHRPLPQKKEIKTRPASRQRISTAPPVRNSSEMGGKLNDLSINRQSMQDFTKKQFFSRSNFPRREPLLRSSHAFRSFVNATINRPHQSDRNFLAEFYAKIKEAVAEHSRKESKESGSRKRAVTEISATGIADSHHYRPPRKPSRSKHLFELGKEREQGKQAEQRVVNAVLAPWQTSPEYQLEL